MVSSVVSCECGVSEEEIVSSVVTIEFPSLSSLSIAFELSVVSRSTFFSVVLFSVKSSVVAKTGNVEFVPNTIKLNKLSNFRFLYDMLQPPSIFEKQKAKTRKNPSFLHSFPYLFERCFLNINVTPATTISNIPTIQTFDSTEPVCGKSPFLCLFF